MRPSTIRARVSSKRESSKGPVFKAAAANWYTSAARATFRSADAQRRRAAFLHRS